MEQRLSAKQNINLSAKQNIDKPKLRLIKGKGKEEEKEENEYPLSFSHMIDMMEKKGKGKSQNMESFIKEINKVRKKK
jgi:hypothetical protein